MILIGGTIKIQAKSDTFKFGKSNKSGKAEINVILALLGKKYSGNENLIIQHIVGKKKNKESLNMKHLGEALHNYQNASKDTNDFVKQFKLLSSEERIAVLDAIKKRNTIRDKDCKEYNKECASHRQLVTIGETQLEKLTRIHDFMVLDKRSMLHKWTDPTQKFSQKQKNRLSKKDKKALKKEYRKSKKTKKNNMQNEN